MSSHKRQTAQGEVEEPKTFTYGIDVAVLSPNDIERNLQQAQAFLDRTEAQLLQQGLASYDNSVSMSQATVGSTLNDQSMSTNPVSHSISNISSWIGGLEMNSANTALFPSSFAGMDLKDIFQEDDLLTSAFSSGNVPSVQHHFSSSGKTDAECFSLPAQEAAKAAASAQPFPLLPPQQLQVPLSEASFSVPPSVASFCSEVASVASSSTPIVSLITEGSSSAAACGQKSAPKRKSTNKQQQGGNANLRQEQWNDRFEEFKEFRSKYGHTLIPNKFDENPALAQWTKRQRYQYKLKQAGKHSTLTDERQKLLEDLDFIWDSHTSCWESRYEELAAFQELNGHCKVPTNYPENPKLSIWVKCQRRQFKLFLQGKPSNMTLERAKKLSLINFIFNPRNLRDGAELTKEQAALLKYNNMML